MNSPRSHSALLHDAAEVAVGLPIERTEIRDLSWTQSGIRVQPQPGKSPPLSIARGADTIADRRRRFAIASTGQFRVCDMWDFHLQIEPIHEWAREPTAISAHLSAVADTSPNGRSGISTGTRIHCS